jgi:hypothetical protein
MHLASLVLASLVPNINMILVLVLFAKPSITVLLAAEYRMELAALMLASLARHINMILVLVLLAKKRDAVLAAAEIRLALAPLVLASLVHHIDMVLVLVLLAEKRGIVLAPKISTGLASFLLAVPVEPRSAYERSEQQRHRPEDSQSARPRNTVGADEGAGS